MVEYALKRWRGKNDEWNTLLAGFVAGLSIVVESPQRRKTISLYVFFRCALIHCVAGARKRLTYGD